MPHQLLPRIHVHLDKLHFLFIKRRLQIERRCAIKQPKLALQVQERVLDRISETFAGVKNS
jgi:hypothetical protein